MLSVASVRSAGGAASYFAADNYYTREQGQGEWFGKGAEALGLSGRIDPKTFEALLQGRLPDGSRVGREGIHRAGIDLTFSMPKRWSRGLNWSSGAVSGRRWQGGFSRLRKWIFDGRHGSRSAGSALMKASMTRMSNSIG